MKCYKSCFFSTVMFDNDRALLQDTQRNEYVVDLTDQDIRKQFVAWFKNVFVAGVVQTLTVFEYEIVHSGECDMKVYIRKFMPKSDGTQLLNEKSTPV